jgi:hypothetical protein
MKPIDAQKIRELKKQVTNEADWRLKKPVSGKIGHQ